MKVAIIGLGLIGGSMALALREKQLASEIVGVDANDIHQQKALELGLVDRVMDIDSAISFADLIILSVPVDIANKLLPKFNEPENSQFKIFMEWGDLFCSYAFKVLKVKEKQDAIDNN